MQATNRTIWQQKVKELEQITIRRHGHAGGAFRNINLKDEWQIYKDLKQLYATNINSTAAVKI
jgi:hypothetical protein